MHGSLPGWSHCCVGSAFWCWRVASLLQVRDMFVFVALSYCERLSFRQDTCFFTMWSIYHFGSPFFCPLNRLRYRWLAVGASYMWLSMVSDVRHCLSSHTSTMSSGHNLLDIPPIFIACCRDTPAYEDSTDGVQVPEVDNKPLLPPASPTPTVKIYKKRLQSQRLGRDISGEPAS